MNAPQTHDPVIVAGGGIGGLAAALANELKAYAKQRMLPHKSPREIRFLDTLPKTGTDKIDRQALKAGAGEP